MNNNEFERQKPFFKKDTGMDPEKNKLEFITYVGVKAQMGALEYLNAVQKQLFELTAKIDFLNTNILTKK